MLCNFCEQVNIATLFVWQNISARKAQTLSRCGTVLRVVVRNCSARSRKELFCA